MREVAYFNETGGLAVHDEGGLFERLCPRKMIDPRRVDSEAQNREREARIAARMSDAAKANESREANDDRYADHVARLESSARQLGLRFPRGRRHPDAGEWEPEPTAIQAPPNPSPRPASKLGKKKQRRAARVSA